MMISGGVNGDAYELELSRPELKESSYEKRLQGRVMCLSWCNSETQFEAVDDIVLK